MTFIHLRHVLLNKQFILVGSKHLENLNFPKNFSEKSQNFRERNLYKHDAYM